MYIHPIRPLVVLLFFCVQHTVAQTADSDALHFVENKGQITDQYGKVRTDIQYVLKNKDVSVFVGAGTIHYQFAKSRVLPQPPRRVVHPGDLCDLPDASWQGYRMDVVLDNANTRAVATPCREQRYHEYYYTPASPQGAISRSFSQVVYKNIYPGIDWILKITNGRLAQEFAVSDGADASLIGERYEGQTALQVHADGSIVAVTPLGYVTEDAPVCFVGGATVSGRFILKDNTVKFAALPGKPAPYVIDPTLEWGTYYGPDSSRSPLYGMTSDNAGHVYACGFTYSASMGNIATAGAFQTTYGGNGDAYLVKFDSSGNRVWATFYGGEKIDCGNTVACDPAGNVYMGGYTASTDSLAIATPGSHQSANGGGWNGFLAKFDASGARIWGTYYGGNEEDIINSVNCDKTGHVYVAGEATSQGNIASAGSFEPTFFNPTVQFTAGFVARFDSAGVRNWGTYYEGFDTSINLTDVSQVLSCTDGNNVFISGCTAATDSIATSGCWQPANAGGATDDFVAKFDSTGNRIWATFYGGEGQDLTGDVVCDYYGKVYLLGATNSDTGIVSAGCYQPLRGGGYDAFLAKFDPEAGSRIWGTYYGGPADENVNYSQLCTNHLTDVYIAGLTGSRSGIASAGAWQTVYGGGAHDAFVAKYDSAGSQLWATYFGGSGDDQAFTTAFDGFNAYVCGQTNSAEDIATSGAFETYDDGDTNYNKGFVAKFQDLDSSYLTLHTADFHPAPMLCFPTPATTELYIGPVAAGFHVALYAITGAQLWYTTTASAGLVRAPINGLAAGTYLVVVSNRVGDVVYRGQAVKW